MSKPVVGNPAKDKAALKLMTEVRKMMQPASIRNFDWMTLASIKRTLGHVMPEVDNYLTVRVKQSQGGQIGSKAKIKAKVKSVKVVQPVAQIQPPVQAPAPATA